MNIDLNYIITGSLSFIFGLLIRVLLDFNLALWMVKYFYWLPVRTIFRSKHYNISGEWEQEWDFESSNNFINQTERHSYTTLKQLGKYIYSEFYSKGDKYFIYGEIKNNFVVGHWGDLNDTMGYFGTFELRIVNNSNMKGKWIGHSKNTNEINGNKWHWTKAKK